MIWPPTLIFSPSPELRSRVSPYCQDQKEFVVRQGASITIMPWYWSGAANHTELASWGMYLNKSSALPTPFFPHGYQFYDGEYPSTPVIKIEYDCLHNHTIVVRIVTDENVVRLNCPIVTEQQQTRLWFILFLYGRKRNYVGVSNGASHPPTELHIPSIQGNSRHIYLGQYILLFHLYFNPSKLSIVFRVCREPGNQASITHGHK